MGTEGLMDSLRRWWSGPPCDTSRGATERCEQEWDAALCHCYGDALSGLILCDYCMESSWAS